MERCWKVSVAARTARWRPWAAWAVTSSWPCPRITDEADAERVAQRCWVREPIIVGGQRCFCHRQRGHYDVPARRPVHVDLLRQLRRRHVRRQSQAETPAPSTAAGWRPGQNRSWSWKPHWAWSATDHSATTGPRSIVQCSGATIGARKPLMRWRRGANLIPPADFVPLVEETCPTPFSGRLAAGMEDGMEWMDTPESKKWKEWNGREWNGGSMEWISGRITGMDPRPEGWSPPLFCGGWSGVVVAETIWLDGMEGNGRKEMEGWMEWKEWNGMMEAWNEPSLKEEGQVVGAQTELMPALHAYRCR